MRSARRLSAAGPTITAIFLLVVSCGAMTVVRGNDPQPSQKEADQEKVRAALLETAAGFERSDLAAIEKVWATDESVTVFEQGYVNAGWTDYRDHHLVPEMKAMRNTKYSLTDIHPKVSDQTAWATFRYQISADLKTRHIEGEGLGTAVLEKRDGRWLIVHWHTSSPPPPPPTKKKT